MKSNKRTPNNILLAVGLCGLGLWAGTASAYGYPDEGARVERRLDRAGDRIERRYDRKGDRIERQLDVRADQLRRQGRYGEARELERLGDRIDHRLDRKGERINRALTREGERAHRDWDYAYRERYEHRVYQPAYCPPVPPRPLVVERWPVYPQPGVTVAIDLGGWVIHP